MTALFAWAYALTWLWPLTAWLALVRLVQLRLLGRLPSFAVFLGFVGAQGTGLALLTGGEAGWWYVLTEPASWLLSLFTVLELFDYVLEGFEGLRTVSRRAFMVFTVLATLLSLGLLLAGEGHEGQRYPVLAFYTSIGRAVAFSLLVFLVLAMAFVLWFRVTLRRNAVRHCLVIGAYLVGGAVGLFVRETLGAQAQVASDILILATNCGCLIAWTLLLRQHEAAPARVVPALSAEAEQRLRHQLSAVNKTLERGMGR